MTVDYDLRDGIARLHLNRPERLNAVTTELTENLLGCLRRAHDDKAAALVLAGRGRAFCAGHDLKESVPVESMLDTRRRVERLQDVTRALRDFPGIAIAAVHGYALGAGCEFALACDLVVAAEDSHFGFPEVGVGLSVTGGISALLPKLVGPYRAKELLVLGEKISATRAAELGLVNRVAAAGRHEDVALEVADQIAARPHVATSLAKRVLDLGLPATLDEAMATEVDHAVLTSRSGENDRPREEFLRS
ncbi:enoyl-CoA hydratase/isomerase family protein [Actinophytocola oryzae]|uniref:Enoyl-CoA hydratase/carnithine racemase n=1 Tax=Actinophytocola oryzae TaxID=502181 RepID=A0A4V3FRI6_9PSEU|nr:enoyl-CoA hydratase/isomerase family protein [Actinophytocola oryzae]TDV43731.1 enoyl-CoA hydratase/carnithine racemase [Actinophytocola oryzae]